MSYLSWDRKTVTDLGDGSDADIAAMYDRGYVFTRVGRGVMDQTRSFRIRLADFELSSENRRILRKAEGMNVEPTSIPYAGYSWEMGKLAKDFYASRDAEFSANKVKEILTGDDASGGANAGGNFNLLLRYIKSDTAVGYAICRASKTFLHYSYPFYIEDSAEPSRGLGMMLLAIQYAKGAGMEYVYLGSLQRPTDTYKLQFAGAEWFDGQKWRTDTDELKELLK